MNYCELMEPRVPDEVKPLITDEVRAVHQEWRELSLADVRSQMPAAEVVDIGDYYLRAVILRPEGHDGDMSEVLAIDLPYQQGWKPSMFIRAEIARRIIAPNRPAVVFPNNSVTDDYYEFTDSEYEKLEGGSIRPLAEQRARALESLGVARVAVTGFSQGGVSAIGLGAVGSDKLEVTHINADEAPHAYRDAKQLRKDFVKSSSWGEQRAAISDARLPVMSSALNVPRLGLDYARFGLASIRKQSKAILAAMSGSVAYDVSAALLHYPEAEIKLGHVAGSYIFDSQAPISLLAFDKSQGNLRVRTYGGNGTHRHSTGDNPFAHALMAKDGIPALES